MLHFYVSVIAQIVIESIPISSSGHEKLIACLLQYVHPSSDIFSLTQSDAVSFFFNMPTLIIIPLFFFNRWWPLLTHIHRTWRIIIKLVWYAWISCVVTVGLVFLIRYYALTIPIWCGFGITGVLLSSLYWLDAEHKKSLSLTSALILGIIQGCAFFPGVSRFASVFVGARWLGFDTQRSFEVAWLIQLPLVCGAVVVSLILLYMNPGNAFFITPILIGIMIISTIMAYVCLKIVYQCARIHRLYWLGIYMIIPMLLSYWCGL